MVYCLAVAECTESSDYLELTTFTRHQLSDDLSVDLSGDSLTTFKSRRLKTYLFRLAFDCSIHVWPHHIIASSTEVTTLWHFMNQFIIIIITTILSKVWLQQHLFSFKGVEECDRNLPLAIDNCWNRKVDSLGSAVINVAHLPISLTSSTAQWFQVPPVCMANYPFTKQNSHEHHTFMSNWR